MMNAWILSIVGVICLGVLLEIVLPDGQTSKYVKGAFSLLVIFVVAAPLPRLLGAATNLKLTEDVFAVDGSFIKDTSDYYAESEAGDLEDFLAVNGYDAEVKIVVKEGSLTDIERIDVELSLSVLDYEELNTHISKARELAAKRLGVDLSDVFVTAKLKGEDGGGSH